MKDAFSHYSSKVLVFTCSKRKAPIFTTFLFYFLYTKKKSDDACLLNSCCTLLSTLLVFWFKLVRMTTPCPCIDTKLFEYLFQEYLKKANRVSSKI